MAAPIVHAADRLLAAVDALRAPVCVGLDPVVERLPKGLQPLTSSYQASAVAIAAFCHEVMEAVSSYVPCLKIQSACFERYSFAGCQKLCEIVKANAARPGPQLILDAKRGDIGVSAEQYAAAAFDPDGPAPPDWLTINSYLGEDGITPFLRPGHGAFALVRTSNPGGDEVQNLPVAGCRTVADVVGEMIARLGAQHLGERGYSSLGAVVGATRPNDAARLRQVMPQQIFLVPGYGAQGGSLDDVLTCFNPDGAGAIVTASRSVIYAFEPGDPQWAQSVADAAARFADDVGRAVGLR